MLFSFFVSRFSSIFEIFSLRFRFSFFSIFPVQKMDVSMNVASSEMQPSRAESRKRPAHHDSLIEKDNSNANGNGEVNVGLVSFRYSMRKYYVSQGCMERN